VPLERNSVENRYDVSLGLKGMILEYYLNLILSSIVLVIDRFSGKLDLTLPTPIVADIPRLQLDPAKGHPINILMQPLHHPNFLAQRPLLL
jgi:hypothetical protein